MIRIRGMRYSACTVVPGVRIRVRRIVVEVNFQRRTTPVHRCSKCNFRRRMNRHSLIGCIRATKGISRNQRNLDIIGIKSTVREIRSWVRHNRHQSIAKAPLIRDSIHTGVDEVYLSGRAECARVHERSVHRRINCDLNR